MNKEIEQGLPIRISVMSGAVGKMGMDLILALFPKTKLGEACQIARKETWCMPMWGIKCSVSGEVGHDGFRL
jgi:hypothetical protein